MKTVSRLSIAPVKGMALQHPDEIRLESRDDLPDPGHTPAPDADSHRARR